MTAAAAVANGLGDGWAEWDRAPSSGDEPTPW